MKILFIIGLFLAGAGAVAQGVIGYDLVSLAFFSTVLGLIANLYFCYLLYKDNEDIKKYFYICVPGFMFSSDVYTFITGHPQPYFMGVLVGLPAVLLFYFTFRKKEFAKSKGLVSYIFVTLHLAVNFGHPFIPGADLNEKYKGKYTTYFISRNVGVSTDKGNFLEANFKYKDDVPKDKVKSDIVAYLDKTSSYRALLDKYNFVAINVSKLKNKFFLNISDSFGYEEKVKDSQRKTPEYDAAMKNCDSLPFSMCFKILKLEDYKEFCGKGYEPQHCLSQAKVYAKSNMLGKALGSLKLACDQGNCADYNAALENKKKYKNECETDNASSCFGLALFLEDEKVGNEKSMTFFEKSCSLNFSMGCLALGIRFRDVHNEKDRALPYFKKACELKNQAACNEL
jgi:hypothetical protein